MGNKALSVATVIEKNRVASSTPFLVLAQIEVLNANTQTYVETIRIVNNPENVTWRGDVYTAWPFSVELRQESGTVPSISLSGHDYQNTIGAKLQEYGGAVGSRVTISVVNYGNFSQAPEVQEIFEIVTASVNNWSVTISLGAESALTRRFPGNVQMRDRCRWRYKGAECGYTGGMPTCDLSLQGANGCAAHGNEANFGGYPGLVSRGMRRG